MENDERYVYVRTEISKKVKIPKDHVKCPHCKGSGEIRIYYGQPWDRGQFATCFTCGGKGYIPKDFMRFLNEKENRCSKSPY